MPSRPLATVVKLILASLAVGMVLTFFDITPRKLIENFGATVRQIYATVANVIEWGLRYVLVGAVVVVPIWLVTVGLRQITERRGK
jgi:hypothetical protein